MYDVIFKIFVEPIAYLTTMEKSRKHTFIIAKDNRIFNNENDIEEYNYLVNEFKQFSDIEYDKISKYCFNTKVTGYMCFYNKEAYEKYKKMEEYIQDYLEKDNKMLYYDTILQQYCEVKTYNPKNKIIKSRFISFEEIKHYDKRDKSLLTDSIYQTIRRELINSYIPEYKEGDIIEYEGKIAIVMSVSNPIRNSDNKVLYTCASLDEIYHCTNYDLEPYTGEISENIKYLLEFYEMMFSVKYKGGEIVEYEGKIAIVMYSKTVENKVVYTCKSLDKTFHCTNYDLKPYIGEISEDIESLLEFYDMMYSIKYKEGEIVEYKGKIAIVMPRSSLIDILYGPGPDPDHKVWYYCKSLDKSFHCTNFDLKPYTGKKSKDIRSLRRSYRRQLKLNAPIPPKTPTWW